MCGEMCIMTCRGSVGQPEYIVTALWGLCGYLELTTDQIRLFHLSFCCRRPWPKAVLISVVSGHDCDLNIFQPGSIHVSQVKTYGPKVPLKLMRKIKADQESETASYI